MQGQIVGFFSRLRPVVLVGVHKSRPTRCSHTQPPWGSLAGAATYPPCASFPRDARDFHHVRAAIDSMIIDPMPTGAVVPEIRQSEFPL